MDVTDILEFYKSFNPSYLQEEANIINLATKEGVVPDFIKYNIINETIRGVIKSTNDSLHYFNLSPQGIFTIIKAVSDEQVEDAERIFKSGKFGCELIKAEGEGAGKDVPAIPPVMGEEEFIEDQQGLTTDRHPGAATSITPDLPERGKQWHQEELVTNKSTGFWTGKDLLDGLNHNLKKSVESYKVPVSKQESKFMMEVLGKSPEEIEDGVFLNPTQKVLYQKWLSKSMKNKVSSLKKWLNGR